MRSCVGGNMWVGGCVCACARGDGGPAGWMGVFVCVCIRSPLFAPLSAHVTERYVHCAAAQNDLFTLMYGVGACVA